MIVLDESFEKSTAPDKAPATTVAATTRMADGVRR
jgi:hypothetical protein